MDKVQWQRHWQGEASQVREQLPKQLLYSVFFKTLVQCVVTTFAFSFRPSVSIRPSTYVNSCDTSISRNCNTSADLNSSRVLRSDTHSSMPIHTLRSQNVDLKGSRLSIHVSMPTLRQSADLSFSI